MNKKPLIGFQPADRARWRPGRIVSTVSAGALVPLNCRERIAVAMARDVIQKAIDSSRQAKPL